jgi:hypothetical protein
MTDAYSTYLDLVEKVERLGKLKCLRCEHPLAVHTPTCRAHVVHGNVVRPEKARVVPCRCRSFVEVEPEPLPFVVAEPLALEMGEPPGRNSGRLSPATTTSRTGGEGNTNQQAET